MAVVMHLKIVIWSKEHSGLPLWLKEPPKGCSLSELCIVSNVCVAEWRDTQGTNIKWCIKFKAYLDPTPGVPPRYSARLALVVGALLMINRGFTSQLPLSIRLR